MIMDEGGDSGQVSAALHGSLIVPGSTLVSCFPSKPQECLCLMNPALLELEEGGDVVNELVVGAPEDAPN
jgi:hypothetical protein